MSELAFGSQGRLGLLLPLLSLFRRRGAGDLGLQQRGGLDPSSLGKAGVEEVTNCPLLTHGYLTLVACCRPVQAVPVCSRGNRFYISDR